jgi:beta-phosphoglucomutase family hydrolase
MIAEIGVLFDMDGVIMDNNPYHEKAWMTFCDIHNVPITNDELHKYVFGRIAKDTVDYIFKKEHSQEEVDMYVNEKEEVYRKMYKGNIEMVSGLKDFLEDLKENGVPAAVATSAPPDNVEFVFKYLPIRNYFRFVLDASDIKNGKPDPEIYIKSISKLGLEPKQCVVFEDSLSGVEAAINSGAHVIAVSTTHKREEFDNISGREEFNNLRGIINNFKNMNYEKLISIITK